MLGRAVTLPSRWQPCVGRGVLVAKPIVRLAVAKPARIAVRCCNVKDDGNYLEAHVVEAVRMVPSPSGHLMMTFTDGRQVEVNHVNPSKGHLLYNFSTPAIFLKMSDDSDLILPIVVGQPVVAMLMRGLNDGGKMVRPNQYQVLKDIVGALNYEARMVKVTERVADTYYARIFIGKPGDEELLSVDARPSDAINLAVRCKIPIFVNQAIVAADAVKPVFRPINDVEGLDRADAEPDAIAEEINLIKNILLAVVEERYSDAARWRDELTKLRSLSKTQIQQI